MSSIPSASEDSLARYSSTASSASSEVAPPAAMTEADSSGRIIICACAAADAIKGAADDCDGDCELDPGVASLVVHDAVIDTPGDHMILFSMEVRSGSL